MKRTYGGVILFLLLGVPGCMHVPVAPPAAEKSTAVMQEPFDSVVEKTVTALRRKGFRKVEVDPDAGIIETEARVLPLDLKDADCGHRWSIPYINDSRCVTSLSYRVTLVRKGEETTGVTVDAAVSGLLTKSADEPEKALTCRSLGTMERSLLSVITY